MFRLCREPPIHLAFLWPPGHIIRVGIRERRHGRYYLQCYSSEDLAPATAGDDVLRVPQIAGRFREQPNAWRAVAVTQVVSLGRASLRNQKCPPTGPKHPSSSLDLWTRTFLATQSRHSSLAAIRLALGSPGRRTAELAGFFCQELCALGFARAQSETAGCATVFPSERFRTRSRKPRQSVCSPTRPADAVCDRPLVQDRQNRRSHQERH